MKKFRRKMYAILLLLSVISCVDNGPALQSANKNTPALPGGKQNSTNSISSIQSVVASSGSYNEIHDPSGTIHLKQFYAVSDVNEQNSLKVYVDPGYVIVGGSAFINSDDPANAKALLTESRPDFDNNAWVGSSKDHLVVGYHTLEVDAIGMRIDGLTAAQLKSYMQVVENTSSVLAHPATIATVSNGYILIGGGARDNWAGAGNLLVTSAPVASGTWYAEGKDHGTSSPASITAYAIGIQNNLPGYGAIATTVYQTTGGAYKATGENADWFDSLPDDELPTCGGGQVSYSGAGRMLFTIITDAFPGNYAGLAASKDHQYASSGYLYAWLITIKKL